jgi:hypothetical protein
MLAPPLQTKLYIATLAAEKKTIYAGRSFKDRRDEMVTFLTAKANITKILFGQQAPPQKSHGQTLAVTSPAA